MNDFRTTSWHDLNQQYLSTNVARIRTKLESHLAGKVACDSLPAQDEDENVHSAFISVPPALEQVCRAFGLSSFERDVLVLCAGVELDSRLAALCASVQGDPQRVYPTFSLTLAALDEPHWSAITPAAPLRRWRLIEVGTAPMLTLGPLRIDERILHYLVG